MLKDEFGCESERGSKQAPNRDIRSRFAKLPHAVVDDKRLSDKALVLLTYRLFFVGKFRLHHQNVRTKVARGLGKDAFFRALKLLQEFVPAGFSTGFVTAL